MVVTHGADGAEAWTAAGEHVHAPAERVDDVVDTNGAGDAFFAGFLVAHRGGADLAAALAAGAHQAARCLRSPDLVGYARPGRSAPTRQRPPPRTARDRGRG